jgi:hypothetical protein
MLKDLTVTDNMSPSCDVSTIQSVAVFAFMKVDHFLFITVGKPETCTYFSRFCLNITGEQKLATPKL